MPAINAISADKLIRLIATPNGPAIVDIHNDAEFAADPRMVPGSIPRSFAELAEWAPSFAGTPVVIVCAEGSAAGHGASACHQTGVDADVLDDEALIRVKRHLGCDYNPTI